MYEDQTKPDTTWNGWYPADFVMEMREQIRLWFYSMLFMSVTLEDRAPYESLFVYEKVMDVKGEPMHRSFGNSIDFDDAVKEMGADVTRWMYVSTNPATNVRFGYEPAKDVVRKLLTLWNVYAFFLTYAELDGFDPKAPVPPVAERAPLDRWIVSRLHGLTQRTTGAMEGYRVYPAVAQMEAFWDDLSNWYVRLSRRRFWKSQADDDKTAAYATLHEVLVGLAKLMGPLVPFLAEELYQNLVPAADPKAPDSLFLSEWPVAETGHLDEGLEAEMETVRRAVGLGRAARATSGIKTRQPLGELVLGLSRPADRQAVKDHLQLVLDEVNVKEVRFVDGGSELLTQEVKPNYRSLGPGFGKRMREVAAVIEGLDPAVCAAAVEKGDSVQIDIDGETHEIGADDLDVRHRELEGYAVANEGGVVAGLALALTEELLVEGKARELVHAVQNARREAGFEVSDRIRLTLSGPEVGRVLQQFGDHIASEVLATEVSEGEPEKGMEGARLMLDGDEMTIGVARVPKV
jgi:isoleucyl-tRNA synthetase